MSFPRIRFLTPLVFTVAAAALLAGWAPQASARGQFGAALMFREDVDFGAQLRWTKAGSGKINIVPQAGYFFDDSFFDANLDLHLALGGEESTSFYALGGLNLVTDFDNSEFGANLGAGLAHGLTENLTGFAELKYVISDLDGLALALGVHF